MGFKLPPLSSLRVFEAAARRGSFKNAAEELNITASAVSHAVQNLEDWLGVELFRRGGGKLELTEPGAVYAQWSTQRGDRTRLSMAERARQRRVLAQLSDRELRDIGLTRYDIEFVLRQSSWR